MSDATPNRRRHYEPTNYFRVMPGRKPHKIEDRTDDRIVLKSARYSSTALELAQEQFAAGLAVGPGEHNAEGFGQGFKLSQGGVILPAVASDDEKTIPIRPFHYKDKLGKDQVRLFADKVSIQKMPDGSCRAVPFNKKTESDVVYFEIWTGYTGDVNRTMQLINAGKFKTHGSVEYSGGAVLVDASSKKKRQTKAEKAMVSDKIHELTAFETDITSGTEGSAELVAEIPFLVVGGFVLWSVRLWKVKYSAKSSEAVLVKHADQFLLLRAPGGVVPDKDKLYVPTEDFEKTFTRLASNVYVPGASPHKIAA